MTLMRALALLLLTISAACGDGEVLIETEGLCKGLTCGAQCFPPGEPLPDCDPTQDEDCAAWLCVVSDTDPTRGGCGATVPRYLNCY